MILIIALMVCYTQESYGQEPTELEPAQAQVHGLYPSSNKKVLEEGGSDRTLLICEISCHGKIIFGKNRSFKVGAKKGEPLEMASDCEFIEFVDNDKITINKEDIALTLSCETLKKIRDTRKDCHIRLQKCISASDAVLLWQAQAGEKEVEEKDDLPSRLSNSADEFKEMVFGLLR